MTDQEVFDRVALHLLTQNKKSEYTEAEGTIPFCKYRNSEGLSCAVGCLIPDDKYDISIEGGSVESMKVSMILDDLGFGYNTSLLINLQHIHDSFDVDCWEQELRRTAAVRELKATVINDFQNGSSGNIR